MQSKKHGKYAQYLIIYCEVRCNHCIPLLDIDKSNFFTNREVSEILLVSGKDLKTLMISVVKYPKVTMNVQLTQ